MSTIKISQLPSLTSLAPNTTTTLLVGVDTTSGTTGKFTTQSLASALYTYNPLYVGYTTDNYPGTISQFTSSSNNYIQVNLENTSSNGSGDYVITADIGLDGTNYIDLGINNSQFIDPTYTAMAPLDGYLYVMGTSSSSATGNLVIGTASANANIAFMVGGTKANNIVGRMSSTLIDLLNPTSIASNVANTPSLTINHYGTGYALLVNDQPTDTSPFVIDANGAVGIGTATLANNKLTVLGDSKFSGNVMFSDGTIQTSAAASLSYSTNTYNTAVTANTTANLAYAMANTANNLAASHTTIITNAYNQANTANTNAASANTYANSAYILANTANNYAVSANAYIVANYIANTSSIVTKGDIKVSGNTTTLGTSVANGYVTVPRITGSAQTSISLNFATDALVKVSANAATIAATLSNANTPGKMIDLWLTNANTLGNLTFTHGCTAQNSTSNTATYVIPGQASIRATYVTFTADGANTMVSLIHI